VMVRLEQTGPGHYEARFPTKEVGSYLLNLMETKDGKLAGSQVMGASVNYSPEFTAPEPNLNLLARLAETGGGKLLEVPSAPGDPIDAANNPFLHDRRKTYQPRDWWDWLLKLAVILFVLDVALRRIQLDREQIEKILATIKRTVFFWKGVPRPVQADESLAALLTRRDEVRATQTAPAQETRPELFQPVQAVKLPEKSAGKQAPAATEAKEPETTPTKGAQKPESTTGRLLDAKRRAQKKME